MHAQGNPAPHWLFWLLNAVFTLFVIASSFWLCLAIWVQQPLGLIGSSVLIGLWIVLACAVLGIYFSRHLISRGIDTILYILAFLFSLFWYFSLDARQDREWNPEVARILSYEQQGDQVTLHNVRNFVWQPNGKYIERWESRSFDLNQITGVNVITSYWMGPHIAHTLVSFDFADQKPLTFSIEIRKEKNEDFSAIGGFFRKFELSLVAADEHDIIYTRSNTRGEQVYFFPVNMPQDQAKALFKEYLNKVDDLAQQPKWYNTLTSNCTTLVFDMVQAVSQKPLPTDYRLIASGYLPNYMYDLQALNQDWDLTTWYAKAHVNPRVKEFAQVSSEQYSILLRQGLPAPQAQ
ncbi:hypothetical protein BS636_03290 [Acinetobacter sp. LoGeW2-3]|uniref:Lnb N-terminal periplasmic domain-containing protein n=1 Tax=Acinetobacter sp. LoGeW2-3 TaxID=1808001 RepID=UPI000C058647|nr:DUF4105 domain-containing protein [Acinetobacter sp. LoGeW2-3]ATO18758.1 hypothetical protein BS636_03290 [Acinetobacter sp. LoGeW2-3]